MCDWNLRYLPRARDEREVEVRWKEAPGAKKLKPDKGDVLMCQTRALTDCVLRVPSEIAPLT